MYALFLCPEAEYRPNKTMKGGISCKMKSTKKVVSLAIKTSKLTAEVLQKAMKALLAKGKGQLTKAPHGKITMRQLMKPQWQRIKIV